MKFNLSLLSIVLAASLAACGGDDEDTMDSSTTDTSADSSGDSATAMTYAVSGEIENGEGATVSERGATPANETTADMNTGAYSLTVTEGDVTLVASDGMATSWDGARTLTVDGNLTNVDISIVDDTDVADIGMALSETINDTLGVIVVRFQDATGMSTVGGEMASITATAGFTFVFDDMGDPMKGTTTVPANADGSEVVFANVPVGMTTVSWTAAGSDTCTGPTMVEAIANTIHFVDITCE